MKKSFSFILIALFASFPFFSQSSEQISAIIESEKLTCSQAAYLPAVYANLISESDSESQAFDALKNEGCFSDNDSADSEVSLSKACGILVKALGIKGGLFYTIFQNDRYAYKELKARSIIPQTADPSEKLSGRDFLDLFNACLELSESNGGDQ